MTIVNDPNLWVIGGLLFVLGLLIGMFLTAGGRSKWKARYNDEVSRRETLERTHKEREADWATREKMREAELATREKEWREQESLRAASAAKSRRVTATDTVVDPAEPLILDPDERVGNPVVDPANKRRRL